MWLCESGSSKQKELTNSTGGCQYCLQETSPQRECFAVHIVSHVEAFAVALFVLFLISGCDADASRTRCIGTFVTLSMVVVMLSLASNSCSWLFKWSWFNTLTHHLEDHCSVFSAFFTVVQTVIIANFGASWNELWLSNAREEARQGGCCNGWTLIGILIASGLLLEFWVVAAGENRMAVIVALFIMLALTLPFLNLRVGLRNDRIISILVVSALLLACWLIGSMWMFYMYKSTTHRLLIGSLAIIMVALLIPVNFPDPDQDIGIPDCITDSVEHRALLSSAVVAAYLTFFTWKALSFGEQAGGAQELTARETWETAAREGPPQWARLAIGAVTLMSTMAHAGATKNSSEIDHGESSAELELASVRRSAQPCAAVQGEAWFGARAEVTEPFAEGGLPAVGGANSRAFARQPLLALLYRGVHVCYKRTNWAFMNQCLVHVFAAVYVVACLLPVAKGTEDWLYVVHSGSVFVSLAAYTWPFVSSRGRE